ncbi:hypothetical protein AB6A40_001074 [Gnathostoma spinigerum]|uniref:Dehydrogenase/reductase SDR family protein 7-like n=1 Tax=Gnathostoma spinigerum TaxID=75299 RepID=A0ABD6E4C8_9BILA
MDAVWIRAAAFMDTIRPYFSYILVPAGIFAAHRMIEYLVPGPQHQSKLIVRNRTVLITGASSGLGRSLAVLFYKEGAKLILAARSIEKLQALCAELKAMNDVDNPNEPVYKYFDMCEPNGVEELVAASPNGKIDILVNNAGQSMRGSCAETPVEVLRKIMEVNFFGHVILTKALLSCVPDDGAIVVISSVQGRIAVPYRGAYSASKHAAQAFFDSLRGEERSKLQILVVSAGYMNTGFGKRALNVEGKPTGVEDADQLRGMTPAYAAKMIYRSLINRETELVLAPLSHRLAIFLRWLYPNLYFWVMHRRSMMQTKKQD